MNSPVPLSDQERTWVSALADEARRDLVFLWHIAEGRFGGPTYQASERTEALERVASALVLLGCIVGFGDPGTDRWQIPIELEVNSKSKGKRIAELWREDSNAFEFLVFALRDSAQSGAEPSFVEHERNAA